MSTNQVISTAQIEIFDEENVRIGYLKKEDVLSYKNTRQDVVYIDAATAGPPLVPVTKSLNLITSTIEYIVIYAYNDVKIVINGSITELPAKGSFILSGSEITSVDIINENTTEVKLEIIQGDELVSGD